ncbi:TIGR02117 family protein [Pontibacter ummariensis]|nr:TIGR02117 family protein [Pontibacter ummariensis]
MEQLVNKAPQSVLSRVGILLAFLLICLFVNGGLAQVAQDKQMEVFITSNGVHTEIVVPVVSPYVDWRERIPFDHFSNVDSSFQYISFGWGDRRFFMETPEWKDLKPGTALLAAFWPTPTAMHVEYIQKRLRPTKQQQQVFLSPRQYQQLVDYIDASFYQEKGVYQHIPGSGYTGQDTFYEANGKYHVLKNCNDWVNKGLKAMGIKPAFWAPLPFAVLGRLR